MDRFDVAVIGSGPAGLEAAVNLQIRGKSFAVFGTPDLSRKLATAPRIDNYLGLPGISGKDLQERFLAHLAQMEIEIFSEQIQMVYAMGDYFSIASAQQMYEATAVILAPGTFSAKLLEGEETYLGRGVGYCATCDAPLYRGKTVAVLGYTDEAAQEADFVATLAAKTYYIPMKKALQMPGAAVTILEGKATAVVGDDTVNGLVLDGTPLPVDGVFILRETLAPDSLLPGLAMRDGFIAVDTDMATSIPGCFAAGDCTGKPHQYMRAAGQGQTAALNAVTYLSKLAKP